MQTTPALWVCFEMISASNVSRSGRSASNFRMCRRGALELLPCCQREIYVLKAPCLVFLKAPELRFRRKLAPTPGKFGIIAFLQDPILHDGNQTSQTRDVFVNCRSVSGWRGAPRRRLTACRDRPHARASHACEEGSHCFTITSTGRRASSVRSLSTEQR